jgi:UDP-GlcNAc:undecaprenyl-phosphate GlcNAc-1-phosphate transferase
MPAGVSAFMLAFVVTMVLTPIVRYICVRFAFHADPNPIIASHRIAIPTLGGIAVYVSVILALAIVMIPSGKSPFLLSLVAASLPVFLMGIYDDLKGLSFKFKGLVEIILVIVFILVFKLRPGFDITPIFDYLLMLLWFVGIINAINLIDIMDGLASGIGLFSSIGFFMLAVLLGRSDLLPICGALAGGYLAFLYYNFNPAKIFLGDNGSLVMGLAFAWIGFDLVGHEPLSPKTMAPVIILGIPIFEVFLLVLRRRKKKIPVLLGSPDHLALAIQALGNSIQKTAVLIFGVSVVLIFCGILVVNSTGLVSVIISLALLIIAVLFLRFFIGVTIPEKH